MALLSACLPALGSCLYPSRSLLLGDPAGFVS